MLGYQSTGHGFESRFKLVFKINHSAANGVENTYHSQL